MMTEQEFLDLSLQDKLLYLFRASQAALTPLVRYDTRIGITSEPDALAFSEASLKMFSRPVCMCPTDGDSPNE